MNAETSKVHDIARDQKDMGATSMQSFEGLWENQGAWTKDILDKMDR